MDHEPTRPSKRIFLERSYCDLNENELPLDESINTVEWVLERSPLENDLVLSKIFEYLDVNNLKSARQVCRKWSDIAVPALNKAVATLDLLPEGIRYRPLPSRSLKDYADFEDERKRQSGSLRGVVFSKFCMNFRIQHSAIVGVMEASWAVNIVSLEVYGLLPEDWNNIMEQLLRSMPSLKKLRVILDTGFGNEPPLQDFRLPITNNESAPPTWSSGLECFALGEGMPDMSHLLNWSFLRFCSSLKELRLNFYHFNGGHSLDWLLNFREAAYPRSIQKLAISWALVTPEFHGATWALASFMDLFPLQELLFKIGIGAQTSDVTNILGMLSKPLRKLTVELNLPMMGILNTAPLSSFFSVLNSPTYRFLEDVQIGLKHTYLQEETPAEAHQNPHACQKMVLAMPNVKKLAVKFSWDWNWGIGQDAFVWIIKNLPAFFPNVITLDVDAWSVRGIQIVFRQAKLLSRLENLTIYGGTRKRSIKDVHLFGKYNATRKNAYIGVLALRGLKTFSFSAPPGSLLTSQTASAGYLRMQSLQVLKIDSQAAASMGDIDLKELKNRFRKFQILKDPNQLSWKALTEDSN